MAFVSIWFYVLFAVAGFVLQSVLPSNIRIIIYPVSFLVGVMTGYSSNYYALSLNIGMISRAAIGGYWYCVAVETILLVSGFVIGSYLV